MVSRTLIIRVLVGVTLAIAMAVIGVIGYQFRRAQLSDKILTKIDRLALQPPDRVPELEWAVQVYWTHNLHCAAMPQLNASVSSLHRLDHDVAVSISLGPDMETIEMLWDRYGRMSGSGSKYRTKYESIRNEIADAIAREGEEFSDIRSYQDFLVSVRSRTLAAD